MSCFILIIIISSFIAPYFLPLISGALALLLFSNSKKARLASDHRCQLLQFIMARALIAYTVIMILINIGYLSLGSHYIGAVLTKHYLQIPLFPVLLLGPILLINLIILYAKKVNFSVCKMCLLENGLPTERSFAGKYYNIEMKHIINGMIIVTSFLMIVTWIYFIFVYNTANISLYDKIIFIGFPVVLWLMKELYLGIRFWAFSIYWGRINSDETFVKDYSLMRYLIICNDELFLVQNEDLKYDTPIHNYIPYLTEVSLMQADENIQNHFHVHPQKIKLINSFNDRLAPCNIYHYFCFIENKDSISISGKWIGAKELRALYNENKLSHLLKIEIFRIYTIILTKKTYTEDGKRIYNIKGYKPVLDLAELRDLDVDFTDKKWMRLSVQNEDNKASKIKIFWCKYIEGTLD